MIGFLHELMIHLFMMCDIVVGKQSICVYRFVKVFAFALVGRADKRE